MRDIYAASFSLGDAGHELPFEPARRRVLEWIHEHAATSVVLDPGFQNEEIAPGHQVGWETLTSDLRSARVWSGFYRHLDAGDASLAWRTSMQLAEVGSKTRFTIRVAIESVGLRVAPAKFEAGRPRIVRTLADAYDGRLDGRPLRSAPEHLLSDDIPGLVELMLDQERRLPVIVLSTHDGSGRPLVAPEKTADNLVGLAHVLAMDSVAASYELTDRIGKLRTVFGGAARIYWPGFALDSDPYDHPVFLASRIEATESRGRPFERYLADIVNQVAVLRVPPEPLVREIREELEARRRQLEDEQRQRLAEARDAIPSDFANELEGSWDRNAELTRRVDGLIAEVDRLADENESLRKNFASVQSAAVVAENQASPEPLPTSVVEALDRVSQEFSDALVVLDEARESASVSPYPNVAKLYGALQAVGEVARLYHEHDLSRGFEAAFEERGLEFGSVSRTAWGKYPSEYQRNYEGDQIMLSPHVKLGSGTSAGLLARVYWWVDEESRRLIVGHVGRHLKDGTT